MKKIIIGMSGASGAIYGIRLLEVLQDLKNVETHLVASHSSAITIGLETKYTMDAVKEMADVAYRFNDIAAPISSGSFKTDGMIVLPCSMKTLAGITNSFSENLLLRAADVVLKDRRRLVIAPRESPLHLGHLRMMVQVTEMGAIIAPPMPAFYHLPQTIDDIVNQTVNRVLDLMGIELETDLFKRWQGGEAASVTDSRAEVLDYLERHQVMTLAVSSAGEVWAAAVFYVNLNFSLFFLSAGHTRHARYLAANPWAAATIQEDYGDWQDIKGIQLEGPVRLLSGAAQRNAIALYGEKFSFIGKVKGVLATALEKVDWYQITAARLYYIDNSKGFGHREEVSLEF